MTEHENNERYISNLEKHIENAKSAVHYSLERFDILIISLSSTALGFSIGFIKDVIKDFDNANTTLLKISWALYGFAIIINLFSQVTSYNANKLEIKISKNIIREEKGKEMKGNQKKFECNKSIFDFLTTLMNGTSLLSLITGIVLMIIFVSINI